MMTQPIELVKNLLVTLHTACCMSCYPYMFFVRSRVAACLQEMLIKKLILQFMVSIHRMLWKPCSNYRFPIIPQHA